HRARLKRVRGCAPPPDAPLQPVQEDRAIRTAEGIGMTGPRDWDKDLAAVDKAIEIWKATTPGRNPASTKAAPVVIAAAEPRKGAMATWLRVLLVLAFAVAVPFWPYPRA